MLLQECLQQIENLKWQQHTVQQTTREKMQRHTSGIMVGSHNPDWHREAPYNSGTHDTGSHKRIPPGEVARDTGFGLDWFI